MFYQMAGLSLQCSLRTILFFIVHLLSHFCTGHSQLIGSPQPIVAKVGDDIILPCHLQPAVDVAAKTFEWTRPDLNPRFVYVWRAGQDVVNVKNPYFKGRTTLFTDELKHGNISLKLSKVKPSDEGRYKCYIPDMNTDASVELVVGAVSSPVISLAGIDRDKGGVVLQCESTGWYPEPEVFWLDGEGNLLSAGPTETVRGPDDLYTVSSRVTVEKRHSNNFTCRVQQKDINQTRETHIQVPDDFFEVQSSLSPVTVGLAVCLAACIMIILLLIFSMWKWRQNRIKSKRSHRDEMDKGEQKERFKRNKPEDQLHIEAEREQLMKNETVTMKSLKNKKGERETKHFKEQQLQEEQQRRDEAEKRVQTLKDELETKRNEVESKQAELQQLQEEKQRKENDLQTVKEELENKNKELEIIQISRISSVLSRRRVQNKEAELKKLKSKLETQEMELNTKIKKIEDKQAEVQQLQDEIQRKETILQTEELERSRVAPVQPSSPLIEDKQDEVQQLQDQIQRTETILQTEELKRSRVAPVQPSFPLFKWPIVSRQKFQDEQQRREEAESRVKTLEEELERLTAEVQKLQQQKQRSQNELQNELETRTKEVKSLTAEVQNLKQEKQRSEDDKKKLLHQLESRTNEVERLTADVQKLQQEKQRSENELKNKLETEKKEVESLTAEVQKLQQEKQRSEKELKNQLDTRTNEGGTSSASQSSKGHVIKVEVVQWKNCICLKNTSRKDQELGGWTLKVQITDKEPISYTFEKSFKLSPGKTLTVGGPNYSSYNKTDLVWEDLKPWSNGDKLQVFLISNSGEIQHISVHSE